MVQPSLQSGSNIGKKFLALIDKHFHKDRQDNLQKIFNRHTVKLSYSCTPNMKTLIKSHNTRILHKNTQTDGQKTTSEQCKCRNKDTCPIPGKCNTSAVIYKATITKTVRTQ